MPAYLYYCFDLILFHPCKNSHAADNNVVSNADNLAPLVCTPIADNMLKYLQDSCFPASISGQIGIVELTYDIDPHQRFFQHVFYLIVLSALLCTP